MAIFLAPFGDTYVENLAGEFGRLSGEEPKLHYFCTKDFRGGEYKIRLVDEHCGAYGRDCDLSCHNPAKLGEEIEKEEVYVVIRGKHGKDWNSDRLFGMAEQATEILTTGSPEYLRGKKAKKLTLVMPHEPFTKQDHLFVDYDDEGNVSRRYEGEPVTVRMKRRILQAIGCDHIITVYPHDYRREGWIRKQAKKGEEHRIITDWRKYDQEELVELEDWTNFVFAINPTDEFSSYIRRNRINIDIATSPDPSGNPLATSIRQYLGLWEDQVPFIDKHRSRAKADEFEIKEVFDPDVIRGKNVAIFDDWVLTGGTLIRGLESAISGGAKEVHVFVVHGAFVEGALNKIKGIKRDRRQKIRIHTMDTIDNPHAVIPTASLIAERLYYLPELLVGEDNL